MKINRATLVSPLTADLELAPPTPWCARYAWPAATRMGETALQAPMETTGETAAGFPHRSLCSDRSQPGHAVNPGRAPGSRRSVP